MGQIFVGQVPLVGSIVTVFIALEFGLPTLQVAAVSVSAGLVLAIMWWFSPLPNGSEFGTGRTTGGGYWGFRKNKKQEEADD